PLDRTHRCSTAESGWATCRLGSQSLDGSRRSTFAADRGGLGSSRSRSTHERRRVAAAETYPEDLRYHPEHDWARIEGDEAVFGVTWFAQDALGELVHFEPPEEAATTTKDQSYAEVESVKAVSDVIAPL